MAPRKSALKAAGNRDIRTFFPQTKPPTTRIGSPTVIIICTCPPAPKWAQADPKSTADDSDSPTPPAPPDEEDLVGTLTAEAEKPSSDSETLAPIAPPRRSRRRAPLTIMSSEDELTQPSPSVLDHHVTLSARHDSGGPTTNRPGDAPMNAIFSTCAPKCLDGSLITFTGRLEHLTRTEAIELVTLLGGTVRNPTSKTAFVVLGKDVEPQKLETIRKFKLKTRTEQEFLDMIQKRHRPTAATRLRSSELWPDKYAPATLNELCENRPQADVITRWLTAWPPGEQANLRAKGIFKYRAVLITGPPGIGKTTAAHLCASLAGYTVVEMNASDTRSRKLVETRTNTSNLTLDLYIGAATGETPRAGKTCLIMDEVDGMSSGDLGGISALVALVKESKIPIICISNSLHAPSLKPLRSVAFNLPFARPRPERVRSRILTIAFKEQLKVTSETVDRIVRDANSDIRQTLNTLSFWHLTRPVIQCSDAVTITGSNAKHMALGPFEITEHLLGPHMSSPHYPAKLSDRMDMYFDDPTLVPLFVQENYLKTQPSHIRRLSGPERILKQLEVMDMAAILISDGDLVAAAMHGAEQHWGLMPLHSVLSSVGPSMRMHGEFQDPHKAPISFPKWLGESSKQSKHSDLLSELHVRMRPRISADKSQLRDSYLPALLPYLVSPLHGDQGKDSIRTVSDRMQTYSISKAAWDSVIELTVDAELRGHLKSGITAATKARFTQQFGDHPRKGKTAIKV